MWHEEDQRLSTIGQALAPFSQGLLHSLIGLVIRSPSTCLIRRSFPIRHDLVLTAEVLHEKHYI